MLVAVTRLLQFKLLAAVLAVASLAVAACAGGPATLEERAVALDRQLMCPICDGQTLDESHSRLAEQIKGQIREMLAAGESDEQIKRYLSDPERYGLVILAAPPASGFNLILWLVPAGAAALGAGLVIMIIRAMRQRETRIPVVDQSIEKLDRYLQKVDDELGINSSAGV